MTRRRPMTAAEYLAKKSKDPEWLAEVERGREADARQYMLDRAEEKPILDDLREAGWDVDSVWDLVNTSEPYPSALPVLVRHLRRGGYRDRVMEGIGRALAVRPAIRYWDDLLERFTDPRCAGERVGAAVALSAAATRDQFDALETLVTADDPQSDAIFFLRALVRIDRKRGWTVLEGLVSHPLFGEEATRMLKARDRRRKRRSQ